MQLHIVGGFLGSGKTTAIAAQAKRLLKSGLKVGVVTNDQGKYLVDTAFFELANVPTVEVTGGCFCCNYDDLEERLANLQETAQPDVIFAESVGSCADVVATVVKPLLTLGKNGIKPTSFSVFTDGRLLHQRLLDLPMPFSDDVVYIFDKQIEEAGLVVVNKVDLMSATAVAQTLALAQQKYPHKIIHPQQIYDDMMVQTWGKLLQNTRLPNTPLNIDYDRYGAGEAELAWLDEMVTLQVPEGEGRAVCVQLLENLLTAIQAQNWAIGHLKFMVGNGRCQTKISFSTLENNTWQSQIPEIPGPKLEMLINARVAAPAEALQQLIGQIFAETEQQLGVVYQTEQRAFFHPGYPKPVHRL